MSLLRKNRKKIRVEIYSKPDCHLCDEAKSVLLKVQKKIPFELVQVNIVDDRELFSQYKEQIPVIFIDSRKAFKFRVAEKELVKRLRAVS